MGLDTHDVGGYPRGRTRLTGPSLSRLRMNRPLQAGMVVTNEPGLYFIEALLLPALNDPKLSTFLNRDKIMDHLTFGGIRLEDDLVMSVTDRNVVISVISPCLGLARRTAAAT